MTNRDEYVSGLRQLADWLEQCPDAVIPAYVTDISVPLMDNASVEAYAAAVGVDVAYDGGGNASVDITFGPIKYYAYGYRDFAEHCERSNEKRARDWAEAKGLAIVPQTETGGAR